MILGNCAVDSLACVALSHYNPLTENEKGMAFVKNALLTACCLLVAVGIFAIMVFYTITVLRRFEYQILTGELSDTQNLSVTETYLYPYQFGTDFLKV